MSPLWCHNGHWYLFPGRWQSPRPWFLSPFKLRGGPTKYQDAKNPAFIQGSLFIGNLLRIISAGLLRGSPGWKLTSTPGWNWVNLTLYLKCPCATFSQVHFKPHWILWEVRRPQERLLSSFPSFKTGVHAKKMRVSDQQPRARPLQVDFEDIRHPAIQFHRFLLGAAC